MSLNHEQISDWYNKSGPKEKREALENLSKDNFKNGATSVDWPLDYIRSLEKSGDISPNEAIEYRKKINDLSKKYKKRNC